MNSKSWTSLKSRNNLITTYQLTDLQENIRITNAALEYAKKETERSNPCN